MKRTAKDRVKILPAIQNALDLWMVIPKIVNDGRLPVKFSWAPLVGICYGGQRPGDKLPFTQTLFRSKVRLPVTAGRAFLMDNSIGS
jgi:hypothetical protein